MTTGRPTADEVRTVEFGLAKHGYEPDQLDDLLEQVVRAIEASESYDELVLSAQLKKARRGYNPAQVDAFLQRLAPTRPIRHELPTESPVTEGGGLFGFLRRR